MLKSRRANDGLDWFLVLYSLLLTLGEVRHFAAADVELILWSSTSFSNFTADGSVAFAARLQLDLFLSDASKVAVEAPAQALLSSSATKSEEDEVRDFFARPEAFGGRPRVFWILAPTVGSDVKLFFASFSTDGTWSRLATGVASSIEGDVIFFGRPRLRPTLRSISATLLTTAFDDVVLLFFFYTPTKWRKHELPIK